MIGVTTDDANSYIDRVDDGPSDKHQVFSELTNDTDLTPADLVAKARDIWPESDDDGVELRVFRHLVYDDGNLTEAARFLDAYPNLESELLRQLPAMQFDLTETKSDCSGIDCIGWISREWSSSGHRQSVCDHVTAEVDALVDAGIEDEAALGDLALHSIWAAKFCDPSTVKRIIEFAEPLVLEVPAGDEWGLGRVIIVGHLSIASYIIGDDEIGARIFSLWMDDERHDVERLVFTAVSLERLGHRHRAKALLRQAWEIAAPYAARSKLGNRNFLSWKAALAEYAMVAAIFELLEEQDTGD